jgi:hypothetical protein
MPQADVAVMITTWYGKGNRGGGGGVNVAGRCSCEGEHLGRERKLEQKINVLALLARYGKICLGQGRSL